LSHFIAERIKGVEPFPGRVMMDKAKVLEKKGEKVTNFAIGEPDFETPEHIKEAAKRAIDEGHTKYTQVIGIQDLREAIAEKLRKDNSIEADPDSEICVTVGAQEATSLACMCTINPGDEVLMSDPGYYAYQNNVMMAGGRAVNVPVMEENDFRLEIDELKKRITSRSKMIVINSPANPTGSIMTADDLEAIAELAVDRELLVLTDEIYEKIIYDRQKNTSIASFSIARSNKNNFITVNGFSKAYAMTGWRIGYVVTGSELLSKMAIMHLNGPTHACSFVQEAAIEALRGPQDIIKKMVDEFEKRRDFIVRRTNEIDSISCIKPAGAFYVFINIKKTGLSSWEMAEYLLNEAKVILTPGPAFGHNGEGYLRMSYATSIENISQGLERIEEALRKRAF
jgi:aminotransferase